MVAGPPCSTAISATSFGSSLSLLPVDPDCKPEPELPGDEPDQQGQRCETAAGKRQPQRADDPEPLEQLSAVQALRCCAGWPACGKGTPREHERAYRNDHPAHDRRARCVE